ncbi:MAG: hypothetical protein FWB93_05645 [Oscillospiraceae bacterium]|nr:hypothetical protein [Oscillospiraceae bacterium]
MKKIISIMLVVLMLVTVVVGVVGCDGDNGTTNGTNSTANGSANSPNDGQGEDGNTREPAPLDGALNGTWENADGTRTLIIDGSRFSYTLILTFSGLTWEGAIHRIPEVGEDFDISEMYWGSYRIRSLIDFRYGNYDCVSVRGGIVDLEVGTLIESEIVPRFREEYSARLVIQYQVSGTFSVDEDLDENLMEFIFSCGVVRVHEFSRTQNTLSTLGSQLIRQP